LKKSPQLFFPRQSGACAESATTQGGNRIRRAHGVFDAQATHQTVNKSGSQIIIVINNYLLVN
jgi:hypothetical protein